MKDAKVDWDAVRRRIQAADAAMARAWDPDPQEVARILKKRAAFLAREDARGADEEDAIEVVEFILDGERYAVESRYVRDVHLLDQLTPIPCTPDFVLGIANLRGEILSVIDIRKFFGLQRMGLADLNRLVVLEKGEMKFCIVADAIAGVHALARAAIQPALPALSAIDHAHGMAPGHLVVLDAQRLMQDARMVIEEQV